MSSEMTTLTICIPFYSNTAYLREALVSVQAQSVANWQVIVVDDNIVEQGCAELVAACKDPRITYVKNSKNLGLAGNWNKCLESARSDLVTLLHADDLLHRDYVRVMLREAKAFPDAAAFFCDAAIIDARGKPVRTIPDRVKAYLTPRKSEPYQLSGPQAIAQLLKGNFIVCPTLCYRTSRLGSQAFSTKWRMVVDFDFTLHLLERGETLVGVGQELFSYRRHNHSQTKELSESLVRSREELALWQEMARLGTERGWHQVASVAHKKHILKLTLLYWIARDVCGGRWWKAMEKMRFLPRMWMR